ncbi:MAG: hypothetical protein J6A63_00665 [Clostridia bacterium]|nr:hypothetical protein [Clostridia bacterium]
MKPIEAFTQDVLQKSVRAKKRRRKIRGGILLGVVALLTFLIAYSNIFTFEDVFASQAYKAYMRSYATSNGDTRLKILDGNNAALTVGERVYPCTLSEKRADVFTLSVLSDYKGDELSVRFTGDKAELSGTLKEEKIEKTLNVVEDMQVQSGVWTCFDIRQNEGGTRGATFDWYLIDETQSYCGTNDIVLACDFVAVGDIVLQCVKDQMSGVYSYLLFESVPITEYGFSAIRNTGYLTEDGLEYITCYYKLLAENEKLPFGGGKFETTIVEYAAKSMPVPYESTLSGGGISWRLFPMQNVSLSRAQVRLQLDLQENGSLSFRSSENWLFGLECGGKWYALENKIFVVLDEKYPHLGLQAFTLYADNSGAVTGDLQQTARSDIETRSLYKVGYHNFTYYLMQATATIYWGNGWTEDLLAPTLTFDTPYSFSGWQTKPHTPDASGERYELIDTANTKLILRENGVCELYRNGELQRSIAYTRREFSDWGPVIVLEETLTVYLQNGKCDINLFKIRGKQLVWEYAYGEVTTDNVHTEYEKYASFTPEP